VLLRLLRMVISIPFGERWNGWIKSSRKRQLISFIIFLIKAFQFYAQLVSTNLYL
jgi:hypothetical protein